MTDFVEKVREFNAVAGTPEMFNARKVGLYTGLILEEVAELIASYRDDGLTHFMQTVEMYSAKFKAGDFDSATATMDRVEALDAAVDIAVVALGQGISVGGNIVGACDAVAENILSKFPLVNGVRTVLTDENGKVKKPPGYKPVDLTPFIK